MKRFNTFIAGFIACYVLAIALCFNALLALHFPASKSLRHAISWPVSLVALADYARENAYVESRP